MKKALILLTCALLFLFGCSGSEEYRLELEVVPPGSGSVSGDGAYRAGSRVTARALPENGYYFTGWEEEGAVVSDDPDYTFLMEKATKLLARFEKGEDVLLDPESCGEPGAEEAVPPASEPLPGPADAALESLPAELAEWVNYSRRILLAQTREHNGKLYLLVTYGQMPSGGYRVEMSSVKEEEDGILVEVVFREPAPGEIVTEALTYPYALEVIEATDKPVEFIASGSRLHLPRLYGLEWLPPLVAGDELIRILKPSPGETVSPGFTVQGIELVFEGTVLYRVLNEEGRAVDEGIGMSGHGTDWGLFTVQPDLPAEMGRNKALTVEIYAESPIDGSEEYMVSLPLLLD